jgi:hypothetical protein
VSETPGENLDEEPQEQRGPQGARDTGSDEPSGGPADRPSGTADDESDTSVQPDKSDDPNAPDVQTGSGG